MNAYKFVEHYNIVLRIHHDKMSRYPRPAARGVRFDCGLDQSKREAHMNPAPPVTRMFLTPGRSEFFTW